jgi:hypothetical protein
MILTLKREPSSTTCTIGDLAIDGVHECYTLEDVVRIDNPATPDDEGKKVYGRTAIPAGRYKIVIDYSQRFQCDMPRLLDVPGFIGIRIHPGNTDADTLGCILVGAVKLTEMISESRVAYNRLFDKLVQARNTGEELWIDVMTTYAVPDAAHGD